LTPNIPQFQIVSPTSTICNRMDHARIAELLAPFLRDSLKRRAHERSAGASDAAVLSPAQLRYISTYIDLLLRWNARINLTAVREPEEIVTRHFGESIFAARRLFPQAGGAGLGSRTLDSKYVIDVGSGAGFPGLPIKIWAPHVRLTLIESNQKKATFLQEVVRSLTLVGVHVFAGRANAFQGSKGDVVALRAVERFDSILPVAAGLVGLAGCLGVLVGEAQLNRVRSLIPGLRWGEPARLPLSSNRVMIIGSK
jgi:16S rRNA (guanine527-N7)-methyltransferase